MTDALLELDGVYAGYGEATVLEGVSFSVPLGDCVVILGPNGVGKSTILRTISGVIKPSAGTVRYQGKDLRRVSDYRIARRGLAHVPEGRGIFPGLSVRENLQIGAHAANLRGQELTDTFERVNALFPILVEKSKQQASSLSGGQQQMLAVGRGLMSRPKLLLLDEPSLGLSPLLVDQVFEALRQIKAQGTTILLVEQSARHALALADYAYVIGEGKVQQSGTADEISSTLDTEYLS
jgi:branched-chain amino acid transport system ATP-binding protein